MRFRGRKRWLLEREVAGLRGNVSALQKKINRLHARILLQDEALRRRKRAAVHDDVYIDRLEALVPVRKLAALKDEMRGQGRKETA